jgi:hypothetical protein
MQHVMPSVSQSLASSHATVFSAFARGASSVRTQDHAPEEPRDATQISLCARHRAAPQAIVPRVLPGGWAEPGEAFVARTRALGAGAAVLEALAALAALAPLASRGRALAREAG